MAEFSAHSRTPGLEPHHHMQFQDTMLIEDVQEIMTVMIYLKMILFLINNKTNIFNIKDYYLQISTWKARRNF